MKCFQILLWATGFFLGAETVPARTWMQISDFLWANAMACSADGTKLACTDGSNIYASTNSGATWTTNIILGPVLRRPASSADGTKWVIPSEMGGIYTSTNSGSSWQQTSAPSNSWDAVASSADGTKLVATSGGLWSSTFLGPIYTSTNSGATWMSNNAPVKPWQSVASSADGRKLVAVGYYQPGVYTSTNSGGTWVANSISGSNWESIASSADGTKLILAGIDPAIYISTDSGATWVSNGMPNSMHWPTSSLDWPTVASSADGTQLVAAEQYGWIYTSTDSGTTWISNSMPAGFWRAVASSADGSKLVAVAIPAFQGTPGVYMSSVTSAPSLNVSLSNSMCMLSWIMPSMDFVLQQNSDLTKTNWVPVTNRPVLSQSSLQEQVVLPRTSANFFRLAAP